jgi:hypothetical protein
MDICSPLRVTWNASPDALYSFVRIYYEDDLSTTLGERYEVFELFLGEDIEILMANEYGIVRPVTFYYQI